MDHYKGISPDERFNNDLLYETRKQTVLLEQIAQLLQQMKEPETPKRTYQRRAKNGTKSG